MSSTEQEGTGCPLTAIHIDLQQRSVTLEGAARPAIRLSWSPRGVLYELLAPPGEATSSPASPITERAVECLISPTQEKEPTVTLTGRLKSQPRAGRPDARGNPTAWARFAAHDEATDALKLYSVTFHRHTAKIALGLERNAQVTVQGYAHPSNDPAGKRLDTLSVINIVSYPGKASPS